MKKIFLMCALGITTVTVAQEIPQSHVPSLIVNNFHKAFPKAYEVSWELKGELYKVEFESGWLSNDHDIWYDITGKMILHKEEISQNHLPQKVLTNIHKSFSGYSIKDIERITEGTRVTYKIELKSINKEWKVVVDSEGSILSKIAD
jgi:uncharacterized membrane protein YkoI